MSHHQLPAIPEQSAHSALSAQNSALSAMSDQQKSLRRSSFNRFVEDVTDSQLSEWGKSLKSEMGLTGNKAGETRKTAFDETWNALVAQMEATMDAKIDRARAEAQAEGGEILEDRKTEKNGPGMREKNQVLRTVTRNNKRPEMTAESASKLCQKGHVGVKVVKTVTLTRITTETRTRTVKVSKS